MVCICGSSALTKAQLTLSPCVMTGLHGVGTMGLKQRNVALPASDSEVDRF